MDANKKYLDAKTETLNWPEEVKSLEAKKVILRSDIYEGKNQEVHGPADQGLIENYKLKIYIPLILN